MLDTETAVFSNQHFNGVNWHFYWLSLGYDFSDLQLL